jgi:hypothetical protein
MTAKEGIVIHIIKCYAMKAFVGAKVSLHTLELDASGHLHTPATLSLDIEALVPIG